MKIFRTKLKAALLATLLSGVAMSGAPAFAERILRLDDVPVGELDPAKATDRADSILMFNIYDALVMPLVGQPGFGPHLAESWETNGKVTTVKLRTDAKFQSGNPVTAADVVFSLERINELKTGFSYLFNKVEKVEAVDDATVRFTLSELYAPFIASLSRLPIIDSKLVMANLGEGEGEMKDWGQAFLSANAAGSGAYTVVSHNPQEETVMKKNDNYFLGVPEKAPDTVRFIYGLDTASIRALMSRGEHDITSQWLPPEVMKSLVAEGLQLFTEAGSGGFYVKMNTQKAPLDDVNCRLALSRAFDREMALKMTAITDTISQGLPSHGAIPFGVFGYNADAPVLTSNMDEAKELIKKCKYKPEEHPIEISWIGEVPLEERFALMMQASFAQLGFDSKITKVPNAMLAEQAAKPETTPHIVQMFVNTVTGDPDALLYAMFHSSNAGTWQSTEHLSDPKVDSLLERGRAELDEEKRKAIYDELDAYLSEIAPTIFAYDRQSVFVASNRVSAPAVSDRSKAYGVPNMGFIFREMEIAD